MLLYKIHHVCVNKVNIYWEKKKRENWEMDQVSIQSFFMPVNFINFAIHRDSTEAIEVHAVIHRYSSLALELVKDFLIWKQVSSGCIKPKVRWLLKWNCGKIGFQHQSFSGTVFCLKRFHLVWMLISLCSIMEINQSVFQ